MVLLLAVSLFAAACGDDDSGGSSGSASATAPTTTAGDDGSAGTTAPEKTPDGLTPVPEGVDLDATLTMSYAAPPMGFDPDLASIGYGPYLYTMYDRLVEISNDLEPIPMLATEWSYSEDGTTFTMKLREDVVFHDGTPFDAEAVVANIERSKTLEGSTTARSLADVESVEAIGEYEVQFNLPESKPANLPQILAGDAGAMISPKAIAERSADLQTGVPDAGSGPYKLVEATIGESATFERAPNFWDPGRQLLAELTVKFTDFATRINGVRSGELDLAQVAGVDTEQAMELAEQGVFKAEMYSVHSVLGMLLNPTRGDLANEKIRQAINFAVDPDEINEGLFNGDCGVQWQTFPEGSKYYHQDIEDVYSYDPDRARELIEESGIEDPRFELHVSQGSYDQMVQVMQAQLEEVGITMDIVTRDLASVVADFVGGNLDAVGLALAAAPDPASLYNAHLAGTYRVMVPADTPEGQAIIEGAEAANDASLSEEEQIEAWHQVWLDFRELGAFVSGCQGPQAWASDESVIGVEDMPWGWLGSRLPYTLGKLAD